MNLKCLVIKIINLPIFFVIFINCGFCNYPIANSNNKNKLSGLTYLLLRHSDSLIAKGQYKENILELNKVMNVLYSDPKSWGRIANPIFTRLAGSYGETGQYDSTKIILKSQARWMRLFGGSFLEYGKFYHNYAKILSLTNSLSKAITANKIAILFKVLDKKKDIKSIISSYRELAYCYSNYNSNFHSKKYYSLILRYIDRLVPMDYDLKFSVIEKYAEVLYKDGDYEAIKTLYSEALLYKYNNEYTEVVNRILSYHNLAELACRPLKEFDSALNYSEKGIKLIYKYHVEDVFNPIQFNLLEASVYYDKEDFNAAKGIYLSCYNNIIGKHNFDLKIKINLVYNLYKCCYKLKQYNEALSIFTIYESLSVNLLGSAYANSIEIDLTKLMLANAIQPSQVHLDSLISIWKHNGIDLYLDIPTEKLLQISNIDYCLESTEHILTNLYQEFKNNEYLVLRLNNTLNSIHFTDYLQSINTGDVVTSRRNNTNLLTLQNGIILAYDLYNKTGQSKYIEIALQLFEKNKSNQLLSAIRQAFNGDIPGLPGDLKQKELNLTEKLKAFMADRFKAIDSTQHNQYFALIQSYKELLENIAANYPGFFKNKYGVALFDVQEFKNKFIDDKTSYLNYFLTDNDLYIILIQQESEKFLKLHFENPEGFNLTLSSFLSIASQKPIGNNGQPIKDYQFYGKSLYEYLIQPVKSVLKSNMVIAADGPLNYLPFDILPEPSNEYIKYWNKIQYLLFNHNISYTSSLSVLKEQMSLNRASNKRTFLGIVYNPGTNNDLKLNQLPFAETEINIINKSLDGRVLNGRIASKSNVFSFAKDFNILHIAAHAKADNKSGNKSYLVLAPDSLNQDGKVYAYDLFKYQLDNDLVVLSACESGNGENLEGEGVIGLTRAFFYAGAKCVLPSLWNVSDYQVSQLLPDFYKELKNGTTISRSLQRAKQHYISSSTNIYAHPFYWGGFITIGNSKLIKTDSFSISLFVLLSLCLAFFIYNRKAIKNTFTS